MRKLVLALLALALLTAPALALDRFQPFTPSQTLLRQLVIDVASVLKDPSSAKFGGYVMGKSPRGDIMACGYVNGRNGFGGYSGMLPYFAFFHPETGHFQVDAIGQTDSEVYAVRTTCAMSGLPI